MLTVPRGHFWSTQDSANEIVKVGTPCRKKPIESIHREVITDMLRLNPDEQAWLNAYRRALEQEHPGLVKRMCIYGSKARGDDHPERDLDMLLIIRNDAHHLMCAAELREEVLKLPASWQGRVTVRFQHGRTFESGRDRRRTGPHPRRADRGVLPR
jgi:predicted nucleotidyltransferase